MTAKELSDDINAMISRHDEEGVLARHTENNECVLSLWGYELVLHDHTPHGSGKYYVNDTSG